MEQIEKLDKSDFISHDFEQHLIMNKVNEIIEAFNKSCTPQEPERITSEN